MTITLTPETETLLREKAQREGTNINIVAATLLAALLRQEAEEQKAMIEAIRQGLEASDAGRVRPFAEFAAQMRTQFNLPIHLSDEEIDVESESEFNC